MQDSTGTYVEVDTLLRVLPTWGIFSKCYLLMFCQIVMDYFNLKNTADKITVM